MNYAADPTNPILMPAPNGFGQVYSNFQLLKISPALAWNATDKLRIGLAANIDWEALAVSPMPIAAPDYDPGPDLTPGTRALLRTVYIMGIILVLLLIALIGGIIWKATSRTPKASEAAAVFDLLQPRKERPNWA